jgi:hypothetical protein
MTIPRQLAKRVMQADCCLYSQWFAGDDFFVTDSLSCDFHLSNRSLTNLITSSIPTQVLFGLRLDPPPRDCFLADLSPAKDMPLKTVWSKEQT